MLCAGDMFDDPEPAPDFWEGLARTFQGHAGQHPPLFLVPGNHDPLTPESVWAPVIRFEHGFPHGCMSSTATISRMRSRPTRFYMRARAGRRRARTIWRWRFPRASLAMNGSASVASMAALLTLTAIRRTFPIRRDAGVQRGLDYLAIGDTHSFRDVTENLPVPTVYPGAPEPTSFDEAGAGRVALVALFRRGCAPASMPSRWPSGGGSTCGAAT